MKKMKKIILSALLISLILVGCKKVEDPKVEDPKVEDPIISPGAEVQINIPDSTFKAILVADSNINKNGDGDISTTEASSFTGAINCQNSDVENAEGIQYFVNVTRIIFFNSKLDSIDLSKNTKVTQLLLEENRLESIDISALSVLTDFKCHSNQLTEANLANGNNANMTRMEIQLNSNLTCIKVDALSTPSAWLKDSTASYNTDC